MEKFKLAISGNNLFENSFGKDPNNIIYNNFEEESLFKFQSYNKTNLLTNNGINLLNINQNEWLDPVKQDIWKSIISTKLGKNKRYFAKNTYVEEIKDNKIKNSFLNQNHLQGEDGSSIKLGLYLKDTNELLSLMTFGKNRYTQGVNYELIRFCNKKYTTIVGAASKLFKYFRTHYLNESQGIVSYADRRHSVGNLYQKLGFTYSHISKPNYKYFHKDDISTLYSRVSFQKHKLESKLDIFENDLSETMNMFNNGYRKIYDSGNFVYLLYK